MKTASIARARGRDVRQARALSRHAVRRVSENFRYVEAIEALRPRPKVVRLQAFSGPLPRLHRR